MPNESLLRIRKNLKDLQTLVKKGSDSKTFSFQKSKIDFLSSETLKLVDDIGPASVPAFRKKIRLLLQGEEIVFDDELSQLQDQTPASSSKSAALPRLPGPIEREIHLDMKEIDICIENSCFRSASVLCGRILEAALHRKYYEVTGNDILETQPGIGLGKLIAKLKEKNIQFPPGITEQIHLINQVRISSVHKKSSGFTPSREQAQAMRLYTIDILRKLF